MSSSFTQPEPPTARSSRRSRSASSSIARLSGSSTPKLNPTDNDIEILLLVEVDVSGSPNKARAKKPSNSKVNTPSRYSLQTSSDKDGRDILSMLNGQARRSNDSSPNKEPTSNMKKRKLPSTPALPSQPSRKSSRLSEKTVDFSNNGLQLKKSPHIIETPSRKTRLKGLGTLQSGGVKSFEEPELAAPQPIYTGLPLESFPTAKIKKESLWPLNKKINGNGLNKKSRSTSYNNSRNSSVTPPDDISSIDGVEQDYKRNLTTSKSEDISSVSEIREPGLPKKKPGKKTEGLKLIIRTPKKIKSNQTSSKATATTSNKVKVISPKKPNNTNLAPINRNVNEQDTHSEGDPAEENEDFCNTCGGSGVFICCDSCPKSFHFTCCEPPLEDCPEDNWHCRECDLKQNNQPKENWNFIGLFGPLLNDTQGRNPIEFCLPRKFRDSTFHNVSSDSFNHYKDGLMKPEISYSKANGSQISGCNKDDDLEIESLYDSKGRPFLCHKCGDSGLNKRFLIHCDYCPLIWHLDCLDNIMCSTKTLGSKWKCPNHVDNLLPTSLFNKRNFKDSSVVEVSLHNHFLQIASMNNLFIKYNDQPYFKDGAVPSFQDYAQFEHESFIRNSEFSFKAEDQRESMDDSNVDIHPNFKLPAYFDSTTNSDDKVVAKASNNLSKLLVITDKSQDTGVTNKGFVYRVPEESIILSFMAKSKELRNTNPETVRTKKATIMEEISNYENRSRLESNSDELELVDGLSQLKQRPIVHHPSNKIDFDELVKIALESEGLTPYTENKDVKSSISLEEIDDLLKIKKLIEAKGRESLIDFLKSNPKH